jgi:DNA-binding NarL/FixJ family response regulator
MQIVLADDHSLVRAGLRSLIEMSGHTVVAEAGDGHEALRLIEKHQPDAAMLDITMPGLNGFELATRIATASPKTRVVILSMHADPAYVSQALRTGVAAYLLKGGTPEELRVALDAVARGDKFLSPSISKQVVDGYLKNAEPNADPLATLTARQREILQSIAEGRSTKEIAAVLELSVKTVETHRAQIMERLGIHDVAGLVRFAIRSGVISADQ